MKVHQRITLIKSLNYKRQSENIELKKRCWRQVVLYLHEAPDVLLFLQEVLVKPAPVGHKLQYLSFPEEGILALLLAPAAGATIGENGQGDNKESVEAERMCVCMSFFSCVDIF